VAEGPVSNLLDMNSAKKFRRGLHPDQVLLVPQTLRDWLDEDHPALAVSDMVDSMDLRAITDSYDERRGQPPYDPVVMVKLLVYAYSRGVRSSRLIERACQDDLGFRYLTGQQRPHFTTIAAFRRRHHQALGRLLAESVRLARRAGLLVGGGDVSVDGTKVKANASRHHAMSYGRMTAEELRLHAEVERYLREAEAEDREEDRRYGKRGRGWTLDKKLADRKARLAKIAEAKAALEAEARARAAKEQEERRAQAEAEGREFHPQMDPQEAKPRAKDQRNFTDPESRIMVNSEKAFIQGFNAQAAVDVGSMIVVAADLSAQAADGPHLLDLVDQATAAVGLRPGGVLADAGYYSQENVKGLRQRGIEGFIPPQRVTHTQWREMKAVRGRIRKTATERERMARKLRTKRGRLRYDRRKETVEPVFGYIKQVQGFRQLLLRGQAKARSMWRFECAVYNLMKMVRAGMSLKLGIREAGMA
jgi:transposase